VPFGDMLRITIVANTANYLVAAGGLSGFALRMYLFVRRGLPAGSAVLVSLVQTLLTNLALLVFVIAGFVLLLASHALVGRDLLLDRPHAMLAPTAYIVLDWAFTLLVLYAAFVAIGHPVQMSYVIAGFAIGMFVSIVSLVPAGLGVLEGSMAAVFATLDVP